MAINTFEMCDKISPRAINCKGNDSNTCRLIKIDFGPDDIIATANKRMKLKKIKELRSPYVGGDKVQLLSRITERKIVHKKPTDFKCSFPLTTNLYKANSDEFKTLKRTNKKVKKSVLTLPNEPVPMPQACTVSDVNDSEYCKRKIEETKLSKRRLINNNKKVRLRNKDFEFYDRDARHCSQLNIDIDSSSTDFIKRVGGDGNRVSNKLHTTKKLPHKGDFKPHDVWVMLKNMNRFPFKASPPMSEESLVTTKLKKPCNKRRNRTERRLIETCRTEEIAYIANFEIDSKCDSSITQSISLDRITVINKDDQAYKKLDKKITKVQQLLNNNKNNLRTPNRLFEKTIPKNSPRQNFRVFGVKENKHEMPPNKLTYDRSKVYYKEKKEGSIVIEKNDNIKSKASSSSVYKDSHDSSNYGRQVLDDRIFIIKAKEKRQNNDSLGERCTLSGNSGTSKNGLGLRDKDNVPRDYQMTGLDKIAVNNERGAIVSNRPDLLKRKSHHGTTLSSGVMPKLTTGEIKRRLAHIKFPLVILGKDQISSTIKVVDYEPPQFDGLNKHIWPFMLQWSDTKKVALTSTPLKLKVNNEDSVNKIKEKRIINDININKKKIEHKRGIPNLDVPSQQPKKVKPIRQFKDKMLKLLYKKPSLNVIDKKVELVCDTKALQNKIITKVDASTETIKILPQPLVSHLQPLVPTFLPKPPDTFVTLCKKSNLKTTYPRLVPQRRPWSKIKWNSEFIENVIKKIKNGVYYNHEDINCQLPPNNCKIGHRDICLQSSLPQKHIDESAEYNGFYEECLDLIPNITITNKYDPLKAIPGFDDSLPALEIKTLNLNQIAVKHCLTNVMVQFDVTVPEEPEAVATDVKQPFSCVSTTTTDSFIPVKETESHTKIFKCKTTILNAILPAELCTMLPKIMRSFLDSNVNNLSVPSITTVSSIVDKIDSQLSTISESTRCESPCNIMIALCLSPVLKGFQDGKFSERKFTQMSRQTFYEKVIDSIRFNRTYIKRILAPLCLKPWFSYVADPIAFMMSETKVSEPLCPTIPSSNNYLISEQEMYSCTALQLYSRSNQKLIPPFENFSYMRMMKNLMRYRQFFNFNIPCSIHTVKLTCNINNITVAMVGENQGLKQTLTVTISKLKINSLFNGFTKRSAFDDKTDSKITEIDSLPIKSIENNSDSCKTDKKNYLRNLTCNKTKRKGFVKLYRKCKSTSNISSERFSTPISKIVTLDDFFQAIGSRKMLSSVFDVRAEHRILSSITEMKSWITDITPRQALLVLLLTNKKNTPNLVRYRPVLLQGIAVNRITRSTELDMEIEVIERENLNKLLPCEGISYLPPSAENHDTLLEELYWIAKTTASDYQKPFDESSEKLLKSLLEKRKKLNPSYLRVMARYVGLGLLKSPNKNCS